MNPDSTKNKYLPRLPLWRRLMKRIHVEGIPWPGTVFYNAVSTTVIFQKHYELVAKDIIKYCLQGNLVDIGTGPGWLLLKLHKLAPELRIVGLDISAAMVAKAKENIASAGLSAFISIEKGSADFLPFADNSLDCVISTGSLHHWKNPIAGLNEIYRVLKNGGQARIYDIVTDIPLAVSKNAAREYGRLKMMMLWLHAWEEPFYSQKATLDLACSSLFQKGTLEFVGVLCCLDMEKRLQKNSPPR